MSSSPHPSKKGGRGGRGGRKGQGGRGGHFVPPTPTYYPKDQQQDLGRAMDVDSALGNLIPQLCEIERSVHSKSVVIMRGIPGCGKSTFAKALQKPFGERAVIVSADDYFKKDGVYNFDRCKLGLAHQQCMDKFNAAIEDEAVELVIVDNTNITAWEMGHYTTHVIRTFTNLIFVRFVVTDDILESIHARNVHGVPLEVCQRRLGQTHRKPGELLVRPELSSQSNMTETGQRVVECAEEPDSK